MPVDVIVSVVLKTDFVRLLTPVKVIVAVVLVTVLVTDTLPSDSVVGTGIVVFPVDVEVLKPVKPVLYFIPLGRPPLKLALLE